MNTAHTAPPRPVATERFDAERSREILGWALVAIYACAIYLLPGSAFSGVFVAILFMLSAGLAFVLVRALETPWLGVVAFLLIGVMEDVLIGAFAGTRSNHTEIVLLVANTTLFASMLLLCSAFSRQSMRVVSSDLLLTVPVVLYAVLVLASAATSSAPLDARAPALRNAGAFLVLFYLGLLLPSMTPARFRRILSAFWWIAAAVIGFGLFERFVVTDELWVRVFNLDQLAAAKNLVATRWSDTPVPADFYTPVGDHYIRRMASLFATPITLGYFLSFALFVGVFEWFTRSSVQRQWWFVVLVSIAGVLVITLVKGAYQIAAVGFIALVLTDFAMHRGWSFGRVLLLWILATIPVVAAGVILFPRSTAFLHVYGLVQTFAGLRGTSLLVGNGLGSGGTVSKLLGADVNISEATGAESGIGTLLYQFGLAGTILYLAIVLVIAARLYRVASNESFGRPDRIFAWAVLGSLLGLLSNVFLQENALAPVPISFFFIFAGLALNPELLRASSTVSFRAVSPEQPHGEICG